MCLCDWRLGWLGKGLWFSPTAQRGKTQQSCGKNQTRPTRKIPLDSVNLCQQVAKERRLLRSRTPRLKGEAQREKLRGALNRQTDKRRCLIIKKALFKAQKDSLAFCRPLSSDLRDLCHCEERATRVTWQSMPD